MQPALFHEFSVYDPRSYERYLSSSEKGLRNLVFVFAGSRLNCDTFFLNSLQKAKI